MLLEKGDKAPEFTLQNSGGDSVSLSWTDETFENKGSRRWPVGYNPKPLISKSIRQLALGLIDQKLTIRRA